VQPGEKSGPFHRLVTFGGGRDTLVAGVAS